MDYRLFFPASQRNKKYIGNILSKILNEKGYILEIGSGSGEHGIEFQKRFPEITWQTSDPNIEHRKSISSWIDYEGLNIMMPQPLDINVNERPWRIYSNLRESLLGIISINMIHITTWKCIRSLFKESGKLLNRNNKQFLLLYGPFKINNKYTSKSNKIFDESLKMQNNNWGIRDLEEVKNVAKDNGFKQNDLIAMPSNNFISIFRKESL